MLKELNQNKGITLVALVVTIVVLLILAGVGLNLVIGENGLIQHAKSVETKWREAEEKEQKYLNTYEDKIEEVITGKTKLDRKINSAVGEAIDGEMLNYNDLNSALEDEFGENYTISPQTNAENYVIIVTEEREAEYNVTNAGEISKKWESVILEEYNSEYKLVLHEGYGVKYKLVEVKGLEESSTKKFAYENNPMWYEEEDTNGNYGSYCWVIEGELIISNVRAKITESNTIAGTIDRSTDLNRLDVNSSTVVDVADVQLLNKTRLSKLACTAEYQSILLRSDVDSDYVVTLEDSTRVYNHIMGY